MPNTASASDVPWTWAMPQSSRVIVTRDASAFHRAMSGGAAAVRKKRSGSSAGLGRLCIRQGLLRLAPSRKCLRACALQQQIGVANAEMVPAVEIVELIPADGS